MGIYLSEHGGTGDGVVGALAGSDLLRSGYDGCFRGKLAVAETRPAITVAEIIARSPIIRVGSKKVGRILAENAVIGIGEVVKAVLIDK